MNCNLNNNSDSGWEILTKIIKENEFIYDKYINCRRYGISVTTIPDNVTRILEFKHTAILRNVIPLNLNFDSKYNVLKWDYFLDDCLPRWFYVYF